MDPGNFLTDSGSKIPKPIDTQLRKVPQKPNLAATTVQRTDFVRTAKVTASVVKSKPATGRSVPDVARPPVRSKTTISSAARAVTKPTVKRHASVDDVGDASAAKISKSAFPYKAKNWELKLRLGECEDWLTEARKKNEELEEQIRNNASDLQSFADTKERLTEVTSLAKSLETQLCEKTAAYDGLFRDSKNFLDKIQILEDDVARKQREILALQADLTKSREEALLYSSEKSKLQISLDELEFKFRRQQNTLEETERSYNDSKKECASLERKVRERDNLLTETEEKLTKCERELKGKIAVIEDLESDLDKTKSKVRDLEKRYSELKDGNENLSSDLANVRDDLAREKEKVADLTSKCDELRSKLSDAEKLRRVLHNQVQDLKGNIRVFCRVRPPLASEKENCLMCSINYPDEGTIEVAKADPFENSNIVSLASNRPKFQKHEFSFDRVFNPSASQALIFEELSQLVQSALDGYNVCIFAYGQTGSGKTYTMEGPTTNEGRGMIPRTVQHIFATVADLERIGWTYTVEVCFMEIYNEVIRDLLRNDKEGSNLKIMQVDSRTNDVVIPGLTVMKVSSFEELDRLYVLAHQNRVVAATGYNERSSRSHSVTKIKVTGVNQERGETCYGSLNLVDLAGSERLNEATHANDPRLREMKAINKSLTELGNVILGLYQKNEHIPYRNSKLTHLLQPALGGSSKTLMLVNISPVESCLSETLCSLRFAQKVNQVKVAACKKRITYDAASVLPSK